MSLTQVTSGLIANTAVSAGTYGGSSQVPVITVNSSGQITSVSNTAIVGGSSSGGVSTARNIINSYVFTS